MVNIILIETLSTQTSQSVALPVNILDTKCDLNLKKAAFETISCSFSSSPVKAFSLHCPWTLRISDIGRLHAHAIDIAFKLAAPMKDFPGFEAGELETALKDIPLPKPGAKGGISVQEAGAAII